jgi:hypothetical protein
VLDGVALSTLVGANDGCGVGITLGALVDTNDGCGVG